ncbi:hypothetical protein BGX38DRAFT_1139518 [Terfezia claveryi]|nr:hypothetical protein BGX38DRAFT_1139518 [Terfezia claveryi]
MDRNFHQMGPGLMPRFPLPHHIPPSSPPASPPRQRQHSNSISGSLSDSTRLQSTIDKSQLLEYSVLRAYPPANASRRRVNPPQPRLVVPPSPPESFIASGTRQYRSGSSATVKTMPRQEEEPDSVPIISSLKGRFNKALTLKRGNHSRQSSDVDKSPKELETGKDITPTTIQTQSPQSAPNSANTVNLSAVSTAHTSLYSHTFPVPDNLLEEGDKGSTTDSSSSYALPTYYNGAAASGSPDQQVQSNGRQTSVDREGRYNHQDFEVKGGEVRIEIRRPHGKENQQKTPTSADMLFKDVYRDRERGNSPHEGPSGQHVAGQTSYSGGEESMASLKAILATVPTSKTAFTVSRQNDYPNLRDRNDLPVKDLTIDSQGNNTKTTDELADETAQYFEDRGFGVSYGMGMKEALPGHSSGLEPSTSEDNGLGSGPADQSSSILGDSTMFSLNIPSDHFIDGRPQRPVTLARIHTSSSSNVKRSPGVGRPSPGVVLTGKTNPSVERSSSIDPSDANEIVRCLSADDGKRLSVLSSPSGSIKSNPGLGAGFTVVVTADDVGEINDMSRQIISLPDEDDKASGSDREGDSSVGKKDKGKGRAMSEQGGRSTGESNESSKDEFGSTASESTPPLDGGVEGRAKAGGESIRVHPGDERYDFVYRVRSSSPDNQPLLIPFYKSPPQSSFPYRNAVISSLPQKSSSQQQKGGQAMADYAMWAPLQLSSGETRPLLDKACIQLVPGASSSGRQIEASHEHRVRLNKVGFTEEGIENGASNTKLKAAQSRGDAAADTMASIITASYAMKSPGNFEEESLDAISTSEPGISLSTARPDLEGLSDFDNQIPDIPKGLPNLNLAFTDRVWESDKEADGSVPSSVNSDNSSENNGSTAENRGTSAENLRLEPTEAVGQVLGAYRRSLYNSDLSSQEFWRSSAIQSEITVRGKKDRVEARIRIAPTTQVVPPQSTISGSRPRRVSLEKAAHLSSVLSRLRPLDLGDRNDPSMSRGRKSFDVAPTLVKRSHIVRPNEGDPPSQFKASSKHLQDPEFIVLQVKYSRALLFLCCLFPPMLIVLAFGGMDDLMPRFTNGKVDNVGGFYKRVAFFLGTLVGTGCCVIPIVMGILLAQGTL